MRRRRNDNKSKQLMLGAFIVIVMVGSMFGVIFYGFNSSHESTTEHNQRFTRNGQWYQAEINNQNIYFNYLPSEVEDIEINPQATVMLKNSMEIDITSDPESNLTQEIALSQYYLTNELSNTNTHVRVGFTGNNSFNAPILTCDDATNFVPVIYFKESNLTQTSFDNNCLTVEIKDAVDATKVKDRLLYAIFEIIE